MMKAIKFIQRGDNKIYTNLHTPTLYLFLKASCFQHSLKLIESDEIIIYKAVSEVSNKKTPQLQMGELMQNKDKSTL